MIDELLAQGYQYGDLPKLTKEYFDKFVDLVGEENITWLTLAKYENCFIDSDEPGFRGQYLLNPAGIERAKEYMKNLDR